MEIEESNYQDVFDAEDNSHINTEFITEFEEQSIQLVIVEMETEVGHYVLYVKGKTKQVISMCKNICI